MALTAAVFGSARVLPGDGEYEVARTVGRLLAEAGWAVMTGGYAGAMEAASRGAGEAGGTAIGVTVETWTNTANRWVTEERPAPDLHQRLVALTGADALLAVGGGLGTLTEVGLSWNLLQKGHADAPLVLVGPTWRRVMTFLAQELVMAEDDLRHITFADDPSAGVAHVVGRFAA